MMVMFWSDLWPPMMTFSVVKILKLMFCNRFWFQWTGLLITLALAHCIISSWGRFRVCMLADCWNGQWPGQVLLLSFVNWFSVKPTALVEPEKCYSYLLEMVKSYLDGNLEAAVYEEQLREVFTVHAYVAYTMDKLIQAIVRQVSFDVWTPLALFLLLVEAFHAIMLFCIKLKHLPDMCQWFILY